MLGTDTPPVRLEVSDLRVHYPTGRGFVRAVDGISFSVDPGEYLGLVGESGCGKSTVVKAILQLLPTDTRVEGQILVDGEDLLSASADRVRALRWTKLALIAQSAMNALDPVYRIGEQIAESIHAHIDVSNEAARERARELFALVGIAPERLDDYPHQFSGGMRQRAVIAMALSLNAGLLLADEPTTALDPIMQDQVLGRLHRIHEALQRSMILVTHDMAVVAETCESIAVMYAGKIMETGPTRQLLAAPCHPYTMGLRNAFPTMKEDAPELISIPGTLPDLVDPPPGCRFASRCPFMTAKCEQIEPELVEVSPGHSVACHYADRAGELREQAARREVWVQVETRWESEGVSA
ncbi:MAG: ATP-binding cassette domain-containing protein [Acidimicrobiia bacterium]|nr:ATP-binding cassette domain-containing protein [Acidimicrobiia bacterium]